MAKDRIPTSRVGRTARIGGLAAGQAIRQAGTHVANVARTQDGRQTALERRHIDAAEQIVEALGHMKGAAMKLGQVMSFLDVGLVPEDYREEFQRKLGRLRDAAPTVTFKDMRKVIEQELDDRLEASNQRTMARIFRGHPFIVVPEVITSLSRERVMVSKYIEGGHGFEELKGYPQEQRDRIGEILFRFYFGSLYRHHQFS